MSTLLKFKKEDETVYVGRNGVGRCIGLELFEYIDRIYIYPTNSKNLAANCQIVIPKSAILDLIKILESTK
jgi:hypothetical protein